MSETTAQEAAKIMGGTVEDNLFEDPTTRLPGSGEFFKFDEVGKSIQGVLVMLPYEAEGKFGMQTIYVVQTAEGKEYNVALKNDSHKMTINGLKSAEIGDLVAFRREADVDTGKGFPAHPITGRVRKMSK